MLREQQPRAAVHQQPHGLAGRQRLRRPPLYRGEELLALLAGDVDVAAHEFLHHDARLVVLYPPVGLGRGEIDVDAQPRRPVARDGREPHPYLRKVRRRRGIVGDDVEIEIVVGALGAVRPGGHASFAASVAAAEDYALQMRDAQRADRGADSGDRFAYGRIDAGGTDCREPARHPRLPCDLPLRKRHIPRSSFTTRDSPMPRATPFSSMSVHAPLAGSMMRRPTTILSVRSSPVPM